MSRFIKELEKEDANMTPSEKYKLTFESNL